MLLAEITPEIARWLLIALVLLGHAVLHVALYNRVNALGWPRWILKTLSKSLFVSLLAIALLAATLQRDQALAGSGVWAIYAAVCLAALVLFGVPFLFWRPLWRLEAAQAARQVTTLPVQAQVDRPLARTWKCRLYSRIPGNQLLDLSIDRCELAVPGLPPQLDGYRIAHLSDLHFTGHVGPEMTRLVVDLANRWKPDLYALTGDIIDKASCIDWLPEALGHAQAGDGAYFILGNHDTRVRDPAAIRRAMEAAGWDDLGGRCFSRSVSARNAAGEPTPIQLLGNEWPWFARPAEQTMLQQPAGFRLLLSHSPDQIWWARRHGVQLMLAGHTHGGQGRLPLLGPLLGPSFHGSRFASGDFYKPPTTMHVSRGLSGTHLMRFRCRPELSLVTLRAQPVQQ